jgi:pantothenate synthetase
MGFRIDYIEEINGRRYGAVYLGEVRLIDNFDLANIKGETKE